MSIDQYTRHANDVESGLPPSDSGPHEQTGDWPKKIRSLSTDDLDRLTIDSAGRFYWDGQLVNYGFAKPDGQLIDSRELSSLASPHQETKTQEAASQEAAPETTKVQETKTGDIAMADTASKQTDATLDAIAQALAAATPQKTDTAAKTEAPHVVTTPTYSASADTLSFETPSVALAQAGTPTDAPVETPAEKPVETPLATSPAAAVALAPVAIAPVRAEPAIAAPREPITITVPVTEGARRFRLSFFQSICVLLFALAALLTGLGLAASGLSAAHEYGCRANIVTAYCPPKPVVAPPARPPRGIID